MIGAGAVTIKAASADGSGEEVTYSKANAGELRAYISQLTAQIEGRPARGAIPVRF